MSKWKILSGLLCLSLVTGTGYAAEVQDFGDENVVVYGDKETDHLVDTTIDLKDYKGEVKSVPELLRGTAGIQIQEKPVSGAEDQSVKLRGHDSRRFIVLVDGVPQKNSGVMGGSYFTWDAMPMDIIEKIEIIKGAKSFKYGQTDGGVINIITKRTNGGSLKVAVGSTKLRQTAFNYRGSADKLDFGINYLYESQDAYLRNADYGNKLFGLNLAYHFSKTDSIRVNYQHNRTHVGRVVKNEPGEAGYNPYYPTTLFGDAFGNDTQGMPNPIMPGDGSHAIATGNRFDITYESKRDNGSDLLTYWKNNEDLHEVKVVNGATVYDRHNSSDKSSGYIYRGTQVLDDKHELAFGGEYTRFRYGYGWYNGVQPGFAQNLYPSQKADVWGLYVGDTWTMDKRWTLEYGLRYDTMHADRDDARGARMKPYSDSGFSPKLTATVKNDDKTTTSFSINRIWRSPSMAEFYWYYQGPAMGAMNHNAEAELKPEKGWGYDLSVAHSFSDKYDTKVSLYYQNFSSFIQFLHTRPFNVYMLSGVKIWGFEWENSYKFDDYSSVYLNYTNQHTSKDGTKNYDKVALSDELDYRPRHMLSLGYQFKRDSWTVRYDMNYVGSQKAMYGYPSAAPMETKIVELGGYAVHNISLTKEFDKQTSANLSVYNLFDKDYCEIYGYPMQGRTYALSCTYNF
ncbi:TonB-dependent receptor [Anaerovibrio sp. JC8]|uniref:TonB-dependent receptor n=1 Tax=Anaerovibrio sp. JC8 TaxID=1240085 RepID=UPI000A0E6803|nr:TonB-dependent receptor [Anaerovibrio sp. JC8]ORT99317.1 TonB-dependent receptor [Anaerovibrio sp. JC8]